MARGRPAQYLFSAWLRRVERHVGLPSKCEKRSAGASVQGFSAEARYVGKLEFGSFISEEFCPVNFAPSGTATSYGLISIELLFAPMIGVPTHPFRLRRNGEAYFEEINRWIAVAFDRLLPRSL